MPMNRQKTHLLLLLSSGSFLLYAIGSGQLPLMGPDEPRYSQVAREMLNNRDFITPTLGGNPWFEKPVLLYWLQAAAYALFGVNEWSARLPSILAAVFTVWITAWTVWRFTHREPALIAGLVLATSLFFIGFGHAATFDMLLTACVATSLCCFLLHEMEPRRGWLWAAYAATGAGVLAKGFVAPIVIGLAMFTYLIAEGKLKRISQYRPVAGSLLALGVAGVWLVPVTLVHGAQFWDDFFFQHHLMRYTTSQFHRSQGVFFYVSIFLAGSYPWTTALFLKSESFSGARPLRRMAWCWFLSTFVFFSLSQSKLPGYILPLMPAFAMLAGLSLYDSPRHPRRLIVLFSALQFLMVIALFLSARSFPLAPEPILAAAILTAVLSAAALFFFSKGRWMQALASTALIPVLAALLAIYGVYPATTWDETRNLASAIRPELSHGRKLLLYHVYNFPLVFYTNAGVELTREGYFPVMRSYNDLHRYLKRHGETHIVVGNEEMEWMRREGRLQIKNILRGPEHSIVLLTLR